MRYRWQRQPNPGFITLHLATRVPRWTSGFDHLCDLDDEDTGFFREMEAIPGVSHVSSVEPYQIGIAKGVLFEWDAIKAEVLAAVARRFCPNGAMVEAASD